MLQGKGIGRGDREGVRKGGENKKITTAALTNERVASGNGYVGYSSE